MNTWISEFLKVKTRLQILIHFELKILSEAKHVLVLKFTTPSKKELSIYFSNRYHNMISFQLVKKAAWYLVIFQSSQYIDKYWHKTVNIENHEINLLYNRKAIINHLDLKFLTLFHKGSDLIIFSKMLTLLELSRLWCI